MLAYRTTRDSVVNFATSAEDSEHKFDQVNIEVDQSKATDQNM